MTDDERGRELVERVARAIYDAATLYIRAAESPVLRADWEANPDKEWTRAQARAAIKAMRDHPKPEATRLHDGMVPIQVPTAGNGTMSAQVAMTVAAWSGEALAAGDALDQLLGHDGTSPGHVPLSMYSTVIAELKRRAEIAEKHWDECGDHLNDVLYELGCTGEETWEETFADVKALMESNTLVVRQRDEYAQQAKAEREQRESEGGAYRKEIEQLKRERDETRKICEGWMANALTSSQQADELSKQIAEAKATIAHWKHLACDPQTRENINRDTERERDEARRETAKLSAAMKQYLGCSDIDWQTLTAGWQQ